LRFINPVTVGLTAVAGAALAANRALDQQREERVATTSGIGRFGQTTAGDVTAIASRTIGNGLAFGQARSAVLAFTRAGAESNEVIQRGVGLLQQYAATVGGDFADAQKDLASLAAEPAKGIDAVQAKTRAFDAETLNHIKIMDAVGNRTAAAKEAFDVLEKSLVRGADATSFWGRQWAKYRSDFEIGLDFLGRSLTEGGPTLTREPPPQGAQRALAAGTNLRPGFAGETLPSAAGPSPELVSANAETAKALDAEARGLALVNFRQKEVAETIRRSTEAHQLDLAAIHAHTAEEQAGVAPLEPSLSCRAGR
jgi:hypothetical protein